MEWWPNLIKRTDLVNRNDIRFPRPPDMRGNIQLIFIMLGVGLATGMVCMVIELRKMIWKTLRNTFYFCRATFQTIFQMIAKSLSKLII